MTDVSGWTRCPLCGGEVASVGDAVRCQNCSYVAYANPAPALCAFVVDDVAERLLFGRRAREPHAGLWDTPGGFAQEGEDALDALRRELREETGSEIEVIDFVGGFADRYGPDGGATLNFYWVARLADFETPQAADDVDALRWFPIATPPSRDEIAFPNTARALDEFLRRRSPTPAMLGMFEIQLVTEDLAQLAAFYRDVLQLQQTVGDVERGRVHFSLGRGQLILARTGGEDAAPGWPGLPPPLLTAIDTRGPTPASHGPVHFAFETTRPHLFNKAQRLEQEGFDVRGPFRWPDGYISVYLHDPDENVVELIAGS